MPGVHARGGFLLHSQVVPFPTGASSVPSLFDFPVLYPKGGFPSETEDFISGVTQPSGSHIMRWLKEPNALLLTLTPALPPWGGELGETPRSLTGALPFLGPAKCCATGLPCCIIFNSRNSLMPHLRPSSNLKVIAFGRARLCLVAAEGLVGFEVIGFTQLLRFRLDK